jgi:16S rRNA (guanine527-N7)-methyltransferase
LNSVRGGKILRKPEFDKIIISALNQLGINFDDEDINKLYEYMLFIIDENRRYNLTAIDSPELIIKKHFLDSLSILSEVNLNNSGEIIDIGTGAGFPGLVLRIIKPELRVTLLDSQLKRINFLNNLLVKLEIDNVEIIYGRSENYGQMDTYREKYKWVVSRAVAPVNILSEYTLPFAKKGGIVTFYKGPDYKDELKQGERSISLLGGSIIGVKKLKVPLLKEKRFIIIIKKTGKTPLKYPRREGIPKKRPL